MVQLDPGILELDTHFWWRHTLRRAELRRPKPTASFPYVLAFQDDLHGVRRYLHARAMRFSPHSARSMTLALSHLIGPITAGSRLFACLGDPLQPRPVFVLSAAADGSPITHEFHHAVISLIEHSVISSDLWICPEVVFTVICSDPGVLPHAYSQH